MVQPRQWIPGLLPLGALVVVAALWNRGPVEQDLTRRAEAGLAGAGLDWTKIALFGRDTVLAGEAPSPEARDEAVLVASRVFGVRNITDNLKVLPEARPFTFTALRDGAKITLTGTVPPGAIRQQIVEAARKLGAGIVVVDDLRVARGASANFMEMAVFGLGQLGKLGHGTLSLSDKALSLSGRAVDFKAFGAVKSGLAALPAGASLAKGLGPGDILPPLVSPFRFEAELSPAGLTLSGFAPSVAARDAVMASARGLGFPTAGELQVADGAPSGDWAGAAATLVKELARLETGKIGLTGANAMIAGRAKGAVDAEIIRADLGALPTGYPLTQVSIESRLVRPFSFTATRTGTGLTLSGHVPDAKARAALLETAKLYFEGEKIDDQMAEGLGEPPDFLQAALAGLHDLSRLADGATLSIVDRAIILKGKAYFDAAREQIARAFPQKLPAGFQGKFELTTAPLPPPVTGLPACQTLYTDLLKRKTVRFRSGSAELSEASRAILDQLAVVSLRCTNARIEIGGHTDNDGSPQSNAELSRRRAETVGAYLVLAGVPVNRLEPVGYGETVPLAPNTSAENKAKNRRIEFFVK
jgi:OmpA-OmpF porin, OOP family